MNESRLTRMDPLTLMRTHFLLLATQPQTVRRTSTLAKLSSVWNILSETRTRLAVLDLMGQYSFAVFGLNLSQMRVSRPGFRS
jgi:hypothetical protein